MVIKEITSIKPPTPQQARINTLKQQKDNIGKQLKAERQRQKVAKAQKQLSVALHPKVSI